MTIVAILLLAAGTYALRAAGPALAGRITPSARVRWLLSVAAAVLLCALVATSALTSGHGFAGWSRPAGVLAGGVVAVRRAPFLAAVVVAVATTATLRLLGVS
jgi:branched chain amino acid efflux pump